MSKLTRRDFLRIASLMGGASLFAGCSLFEKQADVPEYIEGAPAVDPIETLPGIGNKYTVCALCSGACGISCRIAQGKLVKIGGNPFHPVSKGEPLAFDTPLELACKVGASICAIGSSGIQTLYDPFRILKPLKRIGPRGSGKWKAVSWDQAIHEIVQGGNLFGEGDVEGLRTIKASGSGPTLLAGRIDWGALTFVERFFSCFPGATLARSSDVILDHRASLVAESVFGPGLGLLDADYRKAEFLLTFGLTPLDSGEPLVSIAREIANARLKSPCMSWVVVDPRLSTSASKADHWVPIIPGTDDKLALAIAKALFEKYSESLKQRDDELKKLTEKYSFQELASSCGIESGIIFKIADMLVKAGPKSAALCGNSILGQPDGENTARLILTLNSLVGSTPWSGGLLSRKQGVFEHLKTSFLGPDSLKLDPIPLPPKNRALIMWEADPVYYEPQTTPDTLSDRAANPLFITIDRTITETGAFSDYILPDTTYLERWDICSLPPSCDKPGFGVRSPVVGGIDSESGHYFPVLPDNVIMEDILIRLGASVGLPQFIPDQQGKLPNSWQFYQKAFSIAATYIDKQYEGIGQDSRRQVSEILDRGGIFPVSDKKIVSSQSIDTKAKARKTWLINFSSEKKESEEDLILVAYTLPFHRSPRSGINSWLLETLPENKLIINPRDATKRKIKQGDELIVQTTDGKVTTHIKAQVAPGIRPGIVAIAKGFGYKGSGAIVNTIDTLKSKSDRTRGAGINTEMFSGQLPVRVKINKV
ncbi:MAG: molybdopterin-dependent oxidoreductase [Deltaproteobacteria bacterium]|nr:molybdopterin-dependent oxidoreductase [Deltaproteobacteria bacterium]